MKKRIYCKIKKGGVLLLLLSICVFVFSACAGNTENNEGTVDKAGSSEAAADGSGSVETAADGSGSGEAAADEPKQELMTIKEAQEYKMLCYFDEGAYPMAIIDDYLFVCRSRSDGILKYQEDMSDWSNIKQVVDRLVVSADGKVYGCSSVWADKTNHFDGKNIVYLYDNGKVAGVRIALDSDGNVWKSMRHMHITEWEKPVKIKKLSNVKKIKYLYLGADSGFDLIVVKNDGMVRCVGVDEYTDDTHEVILNGTYEEYKCDVSDWSDIEVVDADFTTPNYSNAMIVGLKADGTIVATGAYPEEILSWNNVVDIQVRRNVVVGLQNDGKLLYAHRPGGMIDDKEFSEYFLDKKDLYGNIKVFHLDSNGIDAISSDGRYYGAASDFDFKYHFEDGEVIEETIELENSAKQEE